MNGREDQVSGARCWSNSLLALMLTCFLVTVSCGKNEPTSVSAGDVSAPDQTPATTQQPTEAAPVVPAPAVTQASWAPDALEELLAPIALYPDQVLGQILASSINSQEVLDGGNWLLQNENLKGKELDAAAEKAGFGPAMRALVQYPSVVDMMCRQIDWTRQLGSAFSSDQKGVLDAVQRLRMQAADVGNLKSTPQQTVETKTENGKEVVEVRPADPKIVYVPQYEAQAVYTDAAGLIAFGEGTAVGDALHDDDYYYPRWGYGVVYYGPRPFYPPAYVYRPVYGPAFRPAYRYTSPPDFRYNYNNDYYNLFNDNQNLRAGGTHSPLSRTQARTADAVPQADRGFGASTRQAAGGADTRLKARADQLSAQKQVPRRDSAFSEAQAQGGGKFERAASARGNASVSARHASPASARRR